jgi:hypothetical protein
MVHKGCGDYFVMDTSMKCWFCKQISKFLPFSDLQGAQSVNVNDLHIYTRSLILHEL